jgi:two-component system sensor histidine kinase/response regulator
LLDDSIRLFRMQKPDIEYVVDVDQPVDFINDSFRMSVIIDNLISNAVKYQKPQEQNPRIEITVKTTTDKAVIKIEDNGIGILDQHLNNIFKMFFRSTNSVNGLGIGLYIVKEALLRIGGDISVHSEYGHGTAFTLEIPNYLNNPEKNRIPSSQLVE